MIPWIVSPRDEERARKKAEGLEEEEDEDEEKKMKKEKKMRAEIRKRKKEKKQTAEQTARKDPKRRSHRTKREEREPPSKTQNINIPSNTRQSPAQETIKPRIGGKERKETDQRAPEPRPHAPCRYDALGL